MSYKVKLPIFEGPFDLLLHLIKLEEMDIYDIPIAEIAEKYLEYIEQLQALDLDLAGEYLVLASQLVSMKAKTLLPLAESGDETPEDSDDPFAQQSPREFMRQLVAYRKFKDMARQLARSEVEHLSVAYRNAPLPRPPEVVPTEPEEPLDLSMLLDAFSRVLRFVDREKSDHHILAENYTVEDKIIRLEELLNDKGGFDLYEEFGNCLHKVEVIVTFLAVLELTRLKRIRVSQESTLGHITITLVDEVAAKKEELPAASDE
jgi:segregation and condensation protein A